MTGQMCNLLFGKHKIIMIELLRTVLFSSLYSKGEIDNAVKFLEMYVSVAERAGLQHSLAKAYSAIGIMYNTLVSEVTILGVVVA